MDDEVPQKRKRRDDSEEETPELETQGNKTLRYAGIAAAALALAGISLSMLPQQSEPGPSAVSTLIEIEDPDGVLTGAIVVLDEFVVNLGEANTFFKLKLALEFYDFVAPEFWQRKNPKLRDLVLQRISTKTPRQLLSLEGKEVLRAELIEAINESQDEFDQVVDIYYLNYVIQ